MLNLVQGRSTIVIHHIVSNHDKFILYIFNSVATLLSPLFRGLIVKEFKFHKTFNLNYHKRLHNFCNIKATWHHQLYHRHDFLRSKLNSLTSSPSSAFPQFLKHREKIRKWCKKFHLLCKLGTKIVNWNFEVRRQALERCGWHTHLKHSITKGLD